MTGMLAVARHRIAGGSGAQPSTLPPPRQIDRTSMLTIDWAQAVTIVAATDIPGCVALREQDDVIYDPPASPSKRYACYVTAEFGETVQGTYTPWWEVWVAHSPDGDTWSPPVRCTMDTGGALAGQDPSICLDLDTMTVHRDGSARLWMYLENHPDPTNHSVHAYHSTDGLVWTLGQLDVIPNGGPTDWDPLIGSPNARHVDGQYVVGYEGFGGSTESWGIAVGTIPTALTKAAANPLITGAAHALGVSLFMDSWWPAVDASRIMLAGHGGINNGTRMPRFYTMNVHPATWTAADFVLIGEADAAVRNDLTAHPHGDRLVTAPADDSRIVTVPLA